MTRTTNARLAGITFLFYIAAGIASMTLKGRAHADVLSLVTALTALVLGVTFYSQYDGRRTRQRETHEPRGPQHTRTGAETE
jgi:hypothetical protein